jgi:hypothetical protein
MFMPVYCQMVLINNPMIVHKLVTMFCSVILRKRLYFERDYSQKR